MCGKEVSIDPIRYCLRSRLGARNEAVAWMLPVVGKHDHHRRHGYERRTAVLVYVNTTAGNCLQCMDRHRGYRTKCLASNDRVFRYWGAFLLSAPFWLRGPAAFRGGRNVRSGMEGGE